MCLYPLFLSIPTISISPLSAVLSFLKIFSTGRSGSTKLLPITDYHISIFPWTPKGFTSPESFLNFLLNLYIPPWLRKSFKQNLRLIVLRLLQIHVWRLSMWQFETSCFETMCLVWYLTGEHFWGTLQHVGDVSEQKVKCGPIRTREIVGVRLQEELYA